VIILEKIDLGEIITVLRRGGEGYVKLLLYKSGHGHNMGTRGDVQKLLYRIIYPIFCSRPRSEVQ